MSGYYRCDGSFALVQLFKMWINLHPSVAGEMNYHMDENYNVLPTRGFHRDYLVIDKSLDLFRSTEVELCENNSHYTL